MEQPLSLRPPSSPNAKCDREKEAETCLYAAHVPHDLPLFPSLTKPLNTAKNPRQNASRITPGEAAHAEELKFSCVCFIEEKKINESRATERYLPKVYLRKVERNRGDKIRRNIFTRESLLSRETLYN